MKWWFSRFLLVCLLCVSTFEIKAGELPKARLIKEGFKLSFSGHRLSYSLSFKDNYLELKDGHKARGIYLKSCNKRTFISLDRTLNSRIGVFHRQNLIAKNMAKDDNATDGLMVINERAFPLTKKMALQPSAYELYQNILDHLKLGRSQCPSQK